MAELLTVSELAAELRVGLTTIYTMNTHGGGPKLIRLPSGQVRYRRADVDEWLAGRTESVTPARTNNNPKPLLIPRTNLQRRGRPRTG